MPRCTGTTKVHERESARQKEYGHQDRAVSPSDWKSHISVSYKAHTVFLQGRHKKEYRGPQKNRNLETYAIRGKDRQHQSLAWWQTKPSRHEPCAPAPWHSSSDARRPWRHQPCRTEQLTQHSLPTLHQWDGSQELRHPWREKKSNRRRKWHGRIEQIRQQTKWKVQRCAQRHRAPVTKEQQ